MKTVNIFLLFSITIIVQSSTVKNRPTTIMTQPINSIGFYEYIQKEFDHLQNNYEKNPFKVNNMVKRRPNGKYIPFLYDEFKNRLDNFNAALLFNDKKQSFGNDYPNATECKSSSCKDNMRLNRRFLNFFGFKKNSEENEKLTQTLPHKKYKTQNKTHLRSHGKASTTSKTKTNYLC